MKLQGRAAHAAPQAAPPSLHRRRARTAATLDQPPRLSPPLVRAVMSAACVSAVLFTATSASRAATTSRATSAALSRSAAIRMDFSAREQSYAAFTSSPQAAAESFGEETRDSEPDEDLSILYNAADTIGPAGPARCQTSAAAQIGQLLATRSAADQRRAYEAAAEAARQAAGADAKRAAQDAFLASLAQPRTRADSAKELLQTIKDAGVAGVISFGLVQAAFWGASLPVCLVAYG